MADDRRVVVFLGAAREQAEAVVKRLTAPWRCIIMPTDSDVIPYDKVEALVTHDGTSMKHVSRYNNVKFLQVPFTGYEFLKRDCLPSNIIVCNVYEHERAIAEYVLTAMLTWRRRWVALDAEFKAGGWASRAPSYMCTGESQFHDTLDGAQCGIIGLGTIGVEVARRAHVFGMNVVGCVRKAPNNIPQGVDRICLFQDEVDDVFRHSDFLVLACAANNDTRRLVNAARLSIMKPTAVIINVARGEVIDEAALYEALRSHRIGGAVLDVWWRYPRSRYPLDRVPARPSSYPFHELRNCVCTPHSAGWTRETQDRRMDVVAANLDAWHDGRVSDLRNRVPLAKL